MRVTCRLPGERVYKASSPPHSHRHRFPQIPQLFSHSLNIQKNCGSTHVFLPASLQNVSTPQAMFSFGLLLNIYMELLGSCLSPQIWTVFSKSYIFKRTSIQDDVGLCLRVFKITKLGVYVLFFCAPEPILAPWPGCLLSVKYLDSHSKAWIYTCHVCLSDSESSN